MQSPSVGADFHADGRTDGRTDMTKLIFAFCNFASPPKIGRQGVATDSCHMH